MTQSIAIIGGGPAGFFAAIHAKVSNPNAKVIIFEATNKLLSKVLISGGGRCNVTNVIKDPKELILKYPRGGKELLGPFSRFNTVDTVKWFEDRGVKLKVEADGRIFPVTDNSETIANCLLAEVAKLNIIIKLNSKITGISKNQDGFKLKFKDQKVENYSQVILTTGSVKSSYSLIQNFGHKVVDPLPSLFTFEIKNELIKDLSGVSFKSAKLEFTLGGKKYSNQGPLLITHWGLSGPAVIVLSSHAAKELFEAKYVADLKVDFLPSFKDEDLKNILLKQKVLTPTKTLNNINPFDFANSFWERILDLCFQTKSKKWADLSNKEILDVVKCLKHTKLEISGKGQFKEEFVTCGGVDLKEVDFRTMESKLIPGLYFAGEVLNIDGVTGGFNFQASWTTGFIAGSSIRGEES